MRCLEYHIREVAIDLNDIGPFSGNDIYKDPRIKGHPNCPTHPQAITQRLRWMGFKKVGFRVTSKADHNREILWRCN